MISPKIAKKQRVPRKLSVKFGDRLQIANIYAFSESTASKLSSAIMEFRCNKVKKELVPIPNISDRKVVYHQSCCNFYLSQTIRRKVVIRVQTPPRSRSRSRDLDSPGRGRYRSRSRDQVDGYRRQRSRSRDLDSDRYRDRGYRRSRSRTPPRR